MFMQTYTPVSPIGWSVLLAVLPLFILCLLLVTGWIKPVITYGVVLLLTARLAGIVWKAPLMGWLGTFLTGSNSASIALFGGLQSYAAQITHLPTVGIAACFAVAAVGGKMIAPQALEAVVESSGLASGSDYSSLVLLSGSISINWVNGYMETMWYQLGSILVQ